MSDRQIIGLLSMMIAGGVMLVALISKQFAHGVTNFVDQYLGVGNLASAFFAVFVLILVIAFGLRLFFSKAK